MKIGIITLFGLSNFGNRLQNLAVTELLQQRGCEVETVVCRRITFRWLYYKLKRTLIFSSKNSQKYRAFKSFNKKYIKVRYVSSQNLQMPSYVDTQYDAFVVGSDQVWNPRIRQKERNTFFLTFTERRKRICISPSIGASHIDDSVFDVYREGLSGFNYLSCREELGAKEIQRISGKECKTLIDPTLALDSSYWRNIGNYDDVPTHRYIFVFFLGNPEKVIEESIKQYAHDNQLDIINMLSVDSPYYTKGPSCFISLIDKASLVFTDSFHATAFSINLNTPFFVFDRMISNKYGMINSRITSLLSLFGLRERYLGTSPTVYTTSCTFNSTEAVLKEQRVLMDKYISTCLQEVQK